SPISLLEMAPVPGEHRRRLSGYRMPAEWEAHLATYLVWPHNLDTWPGNFEPIPGVFAKMAAAIASCERLRFLRKAPSHDHKVRSLISEAAKGDEATMQRVELIAVTTNDSWVRDHGPIFVNRVASSSGEPAQIALDWKFNSWGEKYGRFDL